MKPITYLTAITFAGLIAGCAASVPPQELVDARQAYQRASAGQAAQLVPAELHKAQTALAAAEESFKDDPSSFQTRDLSYIADRKSKTAEALAVTAVENAATAKANKEYQITQAEIMKSTKEDLATAELSGVLAAEKLAAEQKARLEAENRAAENVVITLSGSVLFASDKSEILPAAQYQLNEVTDALMENKERKLTVEGHTDSQGSSSYNQSLSLRRAEAVRSYIISRGYPSNLIQAQGIGKDRPIADNGNAEGRANNRRVEIVVARAE
jgi:outer membrane protein OmpA-like peptidoglycan-associated protein